MEPDQRRRRRERGAGSGTNSAIVIDLVGVREPLDRLPQQVAEQRMVRNVGNAGSCACHRLPQRLNLAFGAGPGHAARLPETCSAYRFRRSGLSWSSASAHSSMRRSSRHPAAARAARLIACETPRR